MQNILSKDYKSDIDDNELIASAQQGNYDALEKLLVRHQSYIYNIALRMSGNTHDAEDITQEIMIKILTKLSTFKGNSSFRTWLYRIVSNHIINMKRCRQENLFQSFEHHRTFLNNIPDIEFDELQDSKVEKFVLVEETKMMCMMGMLLCLNRKQRLIFILGSVFGVKSTIGGEIMNITPENFRKSLSRARIQLKNYMMNDCSLLNKNGSCKCSRKIKAAISSGCIDPDNLQFFPDYVQKAEEFILKKDYQNNMKKISLESLFKEQPYLEGPNYTKLLNKVNKIELSWENFNENL